MTDKTRSEMLVNLGDDASTALDNVGGKGANLGKLIKAGFPVPPALSLDSPFISFLLLDADGLIIRERRYHTLSNWPGAKAISKRLGL